jgi:predicted GIY-YIG superfamily endonuclease
VIYILQFDRPLGNTQHRARYYLGYCEPGRLDQRLAEHRAGIGAAITRAAVERGYSLEVVASFPGDRTLERRLKRRKSHRRIVERWQRGTLVL